MGIPTNFKVRKDPRSSARLCGMPRSRALFLLKHRPPLRLLARAPSPRAMRLHFLRIPAQSRVNSDHHFSNADVWDGARARAGQHSASEQLQQKGQQKMAFVAMRASRSALRVLGTCFERTKD